MDFKSILNKLDSMEAPPKGIAAPELPKAIQLDEDAQLRVLAGTSTILAESALMEKAKNPYAVGMAAAKKATGDEPPLKKSTITKAHEIAKKVEKNESVEEEMKVGDTKKTRTGELTKTATGVTHKRTDYSDDERGEAPSTVKQKSASEKKADKSNDVKLPKHKGNTWGMKGGEKFGKKMESAKPDFLDVDGDGDKKEPMKKAAADKGGDKKDSNKGMSAKQAKYFGKKNESVAEAEEKRAPAKKSEREVELPSGAKVKATKVQGWQSQKADKEAKKDANESVESSKELVAESTLTFAKALKIIKESNGTAQIDPLDTDLWKWARRVAENKFTESVKIDVYAATTYERMGGTWSIVQITE